MYTTRPCAQPIYYKMGDFDPRFGISQKDFLATAQKAADLWNQEAGHTVLTYSATGTMPINLVYDLRQQQSSTGEQIRKEEAVLAQEKAQILALESNPNVPREQIQAQITNLNQRIAEVNTRAHTYNAGAGKNFEQGEFREQYGESQINLYEFKSRTQLERLMAHEFGHSIGLDHTTNSESIMYPENVSDSLLLSEEDKAELHARCALTLKNLNPFQRVSFTKP